MITANGSYGIVELKIKGNWPELMAEYKAITDYFLSNHFKEFMAAMDKWNEELNEHD